LVEEAEALITEEACQELLLQDFVKLENDLKEKRNIIIFFFKKSSF
jgi:hypothetical protein